ncbi:c-type cytochrome [Cerina litoralis]
MDKVIGLGRIWRITYDGMERDRTRPNMLEETPAQLVKHLEHPNGWWRDKAQQLIVLHQDKSIAPQLKTMARNSHNLLARFHALWSLEGLDALDPELVIELFKDPEPRMRIQALRASETLYKTGNKSFATNYLELMEDPNTDVAIQAVLTSQLLKIPFFNERLQSLMNNNKAKGIQVVGKQILDRPKTEEIETLYGDSLTEEENSRLARGKIIFNELCVQCHGTDGTGTPMGNGLTMAPPLANSLRVQGQKEYVTKVVLHGLEGPIAGKTYPGSIMVGMGDQSDDWIASVLSYIRLNLDNESTIVSPKEVAEIRSSSIGQKQAYKYPELRTSTPQLMVPTETWKITASHNAPTRVGGKTAPASAFNFEGWSTGEMQQKGMWYQIELPQPVALAEIDFYSKPISRGWRPGSPPPIQTYPRDYVVSLSLDGAEWKAIAQKMGNRPLSTITLNRTKAKFIKIELSKSLNEDLKTPWSMQQMKLYGVKN